MPVLESEGVGWIEEPFPAHDYRSYSIASKFSTLPIAAGENHYTRFEYIKLIEEGSVQILQPDISKTGGMTEAIRISWLVWLHRDTPPDYVPRLSQYGGGTYYPKRGSNHLSIVRKIIATEKRQTYLAPLDPDDDTNENEEKTISSLIGRYKRRAKKTTENVCQGRFPKTVET